ncbi:MAG: helix-turn-helix transcriptional regulator [Clostridiales bacterium]|nr:helix-turn-helix transcriptional regulator [Clostridiales bacterium]
MKNQFATQIRAFRKERGLTQERIAEVFDVTSGSVHKWEAGLSTPDVGLLMEIADFFDTSLDTLMGFDMRDNRVNELAKRLRYMIDNKDLSGMKEAEMALLKYPHSIEIVYESACMYLAFATLFKDNRKYFSRSVELFKTAIRLLPQNTNPKINDTVIYGGLAKAYTGLGETENCIEILKSRNAGGTYNSILGNTLASVGRYVEADIYLSYSIIDLIGKSINFVIGKWLVYLHTGKIREAKDVLLFGLQLNDHFRSGDHTILLDKTDCLYLTGLAETELKLGNRKEAQKYLKKALEKAKEFDLAPDYDARNLRFCSINESCTTYDTTGDKTAIESIEYVLDFLKDKELEKLWKSTIK